MTFVKLAAIAALVALCGCSPKPKLECTSQEATATTIDLIKRELEKAVDKTLSSNDGTSLVGHSKIRASLQQLMLSIEDVRTSKEDPNSTKKFCTGTLVVKAPATMISDAESARSDTNETNLSTLADQTGFDREADKFSISFEYDVQPTDDGNKVFAETADTGKLNAFLSEMVASSLMKSALEQGRIEQQQQQAAQQQQQQSALAEQKAADGAQAKTDNQLANQTITAVWKNLDQDVRNRIINDQRAWIRKKAADCAVEAAGASTDPTEQESARLRCDTKMTQERIQQLQQLPAGSGDGNGM